MQPSVHVGIMAEREIRFHLYKTFLVEGVKTTGDQFVQVKNNKIQWFGDSYDELRFVPGDAVCSFELKDVTIGIGFHWERKENQSFSGALKLVLEGGKIRAINEVRVEDYLKSVISSEMSAKASLPLLKAHAVISRSWLLAQIEKTRELKSENIEYNSFIETEEERIRWYDREDHTLFDVCADDHCQRYQGITRTSTALAVQAVEETEGEVISSEGKICDARFSKCCGGVTEEFEACWEPVHYSYLVALRDDKNAAPHSDLRVEAHAREWILSRPTAFCNNSEKKILEQVLNNYDQETADFYRWEVRYTTEEISALVNRRSGIDFGTILELIPVQRGASGRLIRLKIVGSNRTKTIGKELEIRRILSESHLYSSAFVVDKEDDTFVLRGAGWGHGVGLCQIGAAVMGEQGSPYNEILLHYYPGSEIKRWY
ncbi:MAG: amidase [Bacteroidales bacterium 45-6]|nr:MAG: amidase [Bacteroidales bacterium 45-6]